MKLDEKVIEQIVESVVRKLADQDSEIKPTTHISETGTGVTDGVFRDMTVWIQATVKAQQ